MGVRTTGNLRQAQRAHSKTADTQVRNRISHSSYTSPPHTTVSRALVQERERTKDNNKLSHQVPIYFVSEALTGSKKYYSEMENICYAVVISAQKLFHYFKAHRVRVLTNQPLNDILSNHDSSGRIVKWAMELSEHVIDFEKRSAMKSQVLADFEKRSAKWLTSRARCIVMEPRAVAGQGPEQS
jgi:hypothetical protein